jgi:hypothetical protein
MAYGFMDSFTSNYALSSTAAGCRRLFWAAQALEV